MCAISDPFTEASLLYPGLNISLQGASEDAAQQVKTSYNTLVSLRKEYIYWHGLKEIDHDTPNRSKVISGCVGIALFVLGEVAWFSKVRQVGQIRLKTININPSFSMPILLVIPLILAAAVVMLSVRVYKNVMEILQRPEQEAIDKQLEHFKKNAISKTKELSIMKGYFDHVKSLENQEKIKTLSPGEDKSKVEELHEAILHLKDFITDATVIIKTSNLPSKILETESNTQLTDQVSEQT